MGKVLLADKPGIMYAIDFPNDKRYIGITSRTLAQRLSEHKALARKGAHYSLSRALALYEDNFIAEVLVIAPMSYLRDLEVRAIEAYGTLGHGGYNQAKGGVLPFDRTGLPSPRGMLGKRHSPEAMRLIGEASRSRKKRPLVAGDLNGSKRPEVRAKLSAANKQRIWTEEMRANLRAAWVRRKEKQA